MSEEKKRYAEIKATLKSGEEDPKKRLPDTDFYMEQKIRNKAEKKESQKASRKMLMLALMNGGAGGGSIKRNRKASHKAAFEKRKLQLGTSTKHGTVRQILQQQQQETSYPVSWRDIVRGANIM